MTVGGLPDQVQVLIAPAYGRVQPSTIPSTGWVNIGSYAEKVTITRGTNHELQLPDSGHLTVTMVNYDGSLTPSTAGLFPGLNVGGWINSASIAPHGVQQMPIRIAVVVGGVTYNRFTGYVSKWGPQSFENSDWAHIEIEAYDAMKAATDAYMPSTYLGQQYMEYSPVFWYACNDSSMTRISNKSLQNFSAYDSTGQNHTGTFGAVNDLYLTANFVQWPRPIYNLSANTLTSSAVACPVVSGTQWWLNFLISLDASTSIQSMNPMLIASCHAGVGGWAVTAEFVLASNAWFITFRGYDIYGNNNATIQSTTPIPQNVLQMVTVTVSGGTITLYYDGASAGTAAASGVHWPSRQIVFMGAAGPGRVTYAPWYGGCGDMGLGTAALTAADIGGTGNGFWSYVHPIPRTSDIWVGLQLDAIGPSAADRNLSTGNATLVEPDAMTGYSKTVRAALEQTLLDEVGQLYVDPSGVVVFRNRKWATTAANHQSKAYFGTMPASAYGSPAGFETIPIISARFDDSDDDLYTHVMGNRSAGNPVIVATPAATSIPGRTGGYGVKVFQWPGEFNLISDAQVFTALTYVAYRYNKETVRVHDIKFRPWVNGIGVSTPQWSQILGLDIWDTVSLYTTMGTGPAANSTFEGPLLLEGIDESYDLKGLDCEFTLHTAPAWSSFAFFTIGTSPVGSVPVSI